MNKTRPDMRRVHSVILAVATLCAFTTPAHANAGMETMTYGALIFGPFLIGAGEGAIIAYVFHRSGKSTILWLMAANWVSFLAGFLFRLLYSQSASDAISLEDITTVRGFCGYWFATVILEWPFCAAAMDKKGKRWRSGFLASLLAQSVSYPPLAALMWIGSH